MQRISNSVCDHHQFSYILCLFACHIIYAFKKKILPNWYLPSTSIPLFFSDHVNTTAFSKLSGLPFLIKYYISLVFLCMCVRMHMGIKFSTSTQPTHQGVIAPKKANKLLPLEGINCQQLIRCGPCNHAIHAAILIYLILRSLAQA